MNDGSAKVVVYNQKGIITHKKAEKNVWSLKGNTLNLSKSMSAAKDIGCKYTFKIVRDNLFDDIQPDKTSKKYMN